MPRRPTVLLAFAAAAAAAEPLFPPVSEIDPALLMPEHAERVEIAPDGNFLVEGKPRYLLGTILYHQPSLSECEPGDDYAPENAWIYETVPDRDYLQRLGFDTVGGEVSTTWLEAFRPGKEYWWAHHENDWSLASRYWKSGLPTIVDFTCARWSHGGMKFKEGLEPSRAAIPEGGAGHFMPYSLVTPEGRDLYVRMWRSGAEELRDHGVKPYAYELFNEPTYDDRSPEARAAFAKELSQGWHGSLSAMNDTWGSNYGSFEEAAAFKKPNECVGLGVAWLLFREKCFADGIRLGLETIREVDPDARVCFQPLGISFGYVNVLEANRLCDVVMSPTGGNDPYDTMLLRAVARGKPVIDGETYLGHTRASHRAKILTQWSRGFNASYYFKWERRLWDQKKRGENGAALLAEAFPWLALNPVCTPTEALAGLMDAKRDIFAMEDLFGPRDRGLPASNRVAFLVSQPTERLGIVAGHGNHVFSKANALAMAHDAHLPVDAVFAEQLQERLGDYRVLVAAGVDVGNPFLSKKWVADGGTLVVLQEALQFDDFGRVSRRAIRERFPGIHLGQPCKAEAQSFEFRGRTWNAVPYREVSFETDAGWKVLASLPDGHPAVARRKMGKGKVYYVGVRFPTPGDEGRLVALLAADCGIFPTCETQDPATRSPVDGIEVQAARGENGDVGFVVCNRTLSPRAVRFIPHAEFAESAALDSHAEFAESAALDSHAEFAESAALDSHAEFAESAALDSHAEFAESAEAGNLDLGLVDNGGNDGNGGNPFFLADVSRRVLLAPDSDGAFLLLLEPGIPVVLRGGTRSALESALAAAPRGWNVEKSHAESAESDSHAESAESDSHAESAESDSHAEFAESAETGNLDLGLVNNGGNGGNGEQSTLPVETYSTIEKRMPSWLAERAPKAAAKAFSVDPARVKFLDLREVANRAYGDTVADDGKGGWTDQGENHLRHAPWGPTDCNGVPFDFIRPDQNDDRACVMLRSTHLPDLPDAVRGIAANLRADALYFLHAGAWVEKDAEGFRYVVHYADGASETVPMVGGVDFGDWWVDTRRLRMARSARRYHTGWANSESKGFHVLRWENPHPEKTIATIDIESACGETVPIVEAITAELPDESPFALRRLKLNAWGGVKPGRIDGALELAIDEASENWCGANLVLPSPADFPAEPAACELVFEVNGGRTPLGAVGPGGQSFQVDATFLLADGSSKSGPYVRPAVEGGSVDEDPATWQTARIPVRRLLPKDADATGLQKVNVQYRGLPATRAALRVRAFRLEPAQ